MNFNHFIPNIFYNNIKLILEKSTFSRGIGSIAISEGYGIMKVKDVNEYYHDMDFKDPKEAKIDDGKGSTWVIIIRDCLFLQLTTESEFIIRLQANPTVYLTGLTFSKCKVQKHLINLNSKSTSITHICCSQLDKIGSSDALFLYSETHENSFLKMVYSTITGTNEWRENVNRIFYLHGTCSLKIQCVNISNSDNHQNIDFTSPSCLNMVMNTLQNLDSRQIILLSNQKQNRTFGIYFGMNNFINNKFQAACLYFKLPKDHMIYITDCAFKYQDGSNGNYFDSDNYGTKKIKNVNCVLAQDFGELNTYWIEKVDCTYSSSPTLNILAHYAVNDYCKGEINGSAYGCNNDTCAADQGCYSDAFKLPTGDDAYTEKFHPDINTPTPHPTVDFSQSSVFSISLQFSN